MKLFSKILLGNLFLNKGPQDFPYSTVLLRFSLIVYFLTGLPALMATTKLEVSLIAMALDVSVMLVFVFACLKAFEKKERLVQTVTALALTGAVFQLIILPFLFNVSVDEKEAGALLNLALFLLIFVSWNLAVYAHIFRESFSIRLPAAILLTICYVIMTVLVRNIFFPELS